MRVDKHGIYWGIDKLKPEYRKPGLEPNYIVVSRMSNLDRDYIKKYTTIPMVGYFSIIQDGIKHHCINLYWLQVGWSII